MCGRSLRRGASGKERTNPQLMKVMQLWHCARSADNTLRFSRGHPQTTLRQTPRLETTSHNVGKGGGGAPFMARGVLCWGKMASSLMICICIRFLLSVVVRL